MGEVLRTLDYIHQYGDRETFHKAGELIQSGTIRGAYPEITR